MRAMLRPRNAYISLAVVAALVVAVTFVLIVYAAPKVLEAESGSVGGGTASTITDGSASSGQAVRFGSAGVSLPTMATVGPRCAPTQTISSAQALTTLRSTGTLSCVTVDGRLQLAGSDGVGWVIEDVTFINGSPYGIQAYAGGLNAFTGTQAQRPVLRYIEVRGNGSDGDGGGCSSAVYGRNMIIEYADIYGCSDLLKATDNLEMYYSWTHDADHPTGAHSDAVQIVSGMGIVFAYNRFDAYIGYSSDGSIASADLGGTGNGVLQTGSVTADIQATWTHNWFAGGHYTIRGNDGSEIYESVYTVNYTFRDNRWLRNGTSIALGRTDLQPNRFGPIYGDADTFHCSNVWDDTNEPLSSLCN